jgi:large subunit ribosomal protein L21
MIAVIEIGGKQYTVEKGQMIDVDHQSHDVGAKFDVPALLLADSEGKDVKVGTPTIEGSKVSLKVVEQYKGEKNPRLQNHTKKTSHSYLRIPRNAYNSRSC